MTIKSILLKFIKKDSYVYNILSIIKNSYNLFRKLQILKFYKYSFLLLPKIIKSQIITKLNYNLDLLTEKKKFFNRKYQFTYSDWFSQNIPIWDIFIKDIGNINYLEIGSFEGRSLLYISELDNCKSAHGVDTFEGSDEHLAINFQTVFENFKSNLNLIKKKNISYSKLDSDSFFKDNNSKFNLIYIDGSHEYEDVKKDFINALECLQNNGYIIFDDFVWSFYDDVQRNPMNAIMQCYIKYNFCLKIIYFNRQVILQKKI
jgi:hypothetical protein